MSSPTQTNDNRVLGGHKAAIHNPNVSDEAKEHSRQILREAGETVERTDGLTDNQVRGYKSTLSNPRTSDAAKERALEVLEGETMREPMTEPTVEDEHTNRVLGGYKAAVHNPNVSTEAKRHAHQVLREHDADVV